MKNILYLTITVYLLTTIVFLPTAFGYDFTFSVGNLCEYVGKIQTDDSGSTNFCQFKPYLAASYDYALTDSLLISPELATTLPGHGRDENISKLSFYTLINTKYKLSVFHFIGGLGLYFTKISGNGGSETLNNGNSTVNFSIPEKTIFTRNFIMNLGAGWDFDPKWNTDLHLLVFNLTSSEDRAYTIALNLTYHYGEF